MAEISLVIPDELLREIDAQAGGNRLAFIVDAALDRVHRMRREMLDREIIESLGSDGDADAQVYSAWGVTMNDGLAQSFVKDRQISADSS